MSIFTFVVHGSLTLGPQEGGGDHQGTRPEKKKHCEWSDKTSVSN